MSIAFEFIVIAIMLVINGLFAAYEMALAARDLSPELTIRAAGGAHEMDHTRTREG